MKNFRIQFNLTGTDIPARLSPKYGDVLHIRYEDTGGDKCVECGHKLEAPFLLTATFNGRQVLREYIAFKDLLKEFTPHIHERADVMYDALRKDAR